MVTLALGLALLAPAPATAQSRWDLHVATFIGLVEDGHLFTIAPSTFICRFSRSMRMEAAPTIHGTPNWRATTAACEVAPPSLVRMPFAASIPWTSSGLVNGRTIITS
jgi:hypothetical protein